ncbi:MAG: histidine phosphatase family protein [Neisseriaceae bacterium]|nr:hypothetical protein [Neisseriaceae bacterium PsAf]MCV2503483.1 histidine phosphatase family protein [Neisseriaceae bacterium]MCV2508942.1 histidine phosphatase family protein [Neisseriaceae bacterium]
MELLLWRHAEAEDNPDDMKRHLTKKGLQQAEKMVKWITKHFPNEHTVWVSEAIRTQETANFLKHKPAIKPHLNPSSSAAIILNDILNNIFSENLIIVGHQPWIGDLTAHLIYNTHYNSYANRPLYWSFKKASIWWLEIKQDDEHAFYTKVKANLSPDLLD